MVGVPRNPNGEAPAASAGGSFNLGDTWNWAIGNLTFWDQENGESAVIRTRLESLGDKPYAQQTLAKLQELNATDGGFDMATELDDIQSTFMSSLGEYLDTLPADKRFAEFKTAVTTLNPNDSTSQMLNAFEKAPAHVQQALTYAVTESPAFLKYLSEPGSTDGLGGILSEDILKNPQYAGPIADILTSIGNNPGTLNPATGEYEGGYDFDKLDALGKAATEYFEADALTGDKRDPELIALRRKELLSAVQGAGGNIPAIANMTPELLMQFLNDLFNGDMDYAIGNLADGLGLEGQQLQDFQELIKPLAGILKFMGQDYYDYAQYYAPEVVAYGTKAWGTVDGVLNGQRVQQNSATDVATTDAEPATPGDVAAVNEESTRSASMSGNGLTTEVASLNMYYNGNSSGAVLDGYKPDPAPGTARTYTPSFGSYDAVPT